MSDIPTGYCQCGCGERTNIAKYDNPKLGHIKGQPFRFCKSHRAPFKMPNQVPVKERFFSHVEIQGSDDCWNWKGARLPSGQGQFRFGKTMLAHRASYELHFGQIPRTLNVLHKCNNPACVNPAHLFTATSSDSHNKKHQAARDNIVSALALTDSDLKEIYSLIDSKTPFDDISRQYSIHKLILNRIAQRYKQVKHK